MAYLAGTQGLCTMGGGLENERKNSKEAPSKSPSSSASFLFIARPPRASLQSFQTALCGLHLFSSGHSSTTCVSVIVFPHLHLHLSVSDFRILNNHSFCGPLFVRHQVYADSAFLHQPRSPFPFPPLASTLSLSSCPRSHVARTEPYEL